MSLIKINTFLNKESAVYLLLVLTIYSGLTIFLIQYYPVFVDEALTYHLFVNIPFNSTISSYNPNNHVLFSLIANVFKFIPIDNLIKLRIPNYLIGLITSVFTYLYFKSKFGHLVAVLPHVLLTFSYCFIFYSVFARGYMLIILCNLMCFIFAEKFNTELKTKYLIGFLFFTCLGFFTIPIFLYCSLVHGIILLVFNYQSWKRIKSIFFTYLFVLIGVVALYSPIIFNQGISSLIGNDYVKSLSSEQILNFFNSKMFMGIFDKITAIPSFWFVFAMIITMFLILFKSNAKKERFGIIFVIISICSPLIFILLQRVIPGSRTWTYLIFSISLGVAYLLYFLFSKYLKKWIVYTGAILIFTLQIILLQKSNPKAALEYDLQNQIISHYLLDHNVEKILIETKNTYIGEQLSVLFEYERKNKKISIQNVIQLPELYNDNDCLFLLKNNKNSFDGYKMIGKTVFFNVYVKEL